MPTPPSPIDPPPRAANSARQDRSRETLSRILAAAAELLEDREFDELTMAELAAHAGCAVGTVYARLPNKESLLLCLHERYVQTGMTGAGRMFDRHADAGLEERVRAICGLMVDFMSAHRGVTRAITNYLYARPRGDTSSNIAIFRRNATVSFKLAAAFLAERVDRRVHAAPQRACEFALLAAHDVAQSRIVFGDRSGLRINYASRTLKARLTSLLLAYLQHG